jgi:DNA-binding response OmpR family regulator
VETAGPISLELTSGSGLGEPTGSIDRRRSDRGTSGGDRLYLVELGGRAPADLAGWLSRNRDTVRLTDGMSLIQKLPSTPAGTVCVYVDREHTDEAVELIRALRPLTPAAVLLLSDHELRSGEHAAALAAGADDVLSGGIDFGELDARIRRARESSRRQDPAPAAEAGPVPIDGLLDEADFRQMLDDRLDSREEELFSLLRFDLPQVRDMGEALLSSVRSDSGDVVGPLAGGYGVLLQDARAQQAESFLRRVQTELRRRGHDVTLEAEILSNPEQREHIRALVGT